MRLTETNGGCTDRRYKPRGMSWRGRAGHGLAPLRRVENPRRTPNGERLIAARFLRAFAEEDPHGALWEILNDAEAISTDHWVKTLADAAVVLLDRDRALELLTAIAQRLDPKIVPKSLFAVLKLIETHDSLAAAVFVPPHRENMRVCAGSSGTA
jgi:hypothetical protein